jgi:2,6-dihydroxypyridine 3-monooxygenase
MPARVAVIGGSLGGLTAALVLRDAGCDVDVFERSPSKLESRGAGIVLMPVTMRYLHERRGVRVEAISTSAERLWYADAGGGAVYEEPCRYRFTAWNTLQRALLECFDPDCYHLGEAMTALDQDGDGAWVTLDGGRRARFDLVVCADGVSSTARRLLLPDVQPRYAGYVAWRGTVPESEMSAAGLAPLSASFTYHLTRPGHIVAYPIPAVDGSVAPGRRLMNFVWYRNLPGGEPLDAVLTDREGVRRELSIPAGGLQDRFAGELREAAAALPPALREVVERTEQPFIQAILDLEVPRMVFGRVCLIGDAAFVARPHAGAGTAKAAADAWGLAERLRDSGGDVDAALGAWEPVQLLMGSRLVARVRDMGDRSQFDGTWRPGDPALRLGLWGPGC